MLARMQSIRTLAIRVASPCAAAEVRIINPDAGGLRVEVVLK